MTIEELKMKVEEMRKQLALHKGHIIMSSENGPIGITLIDALVAAVETLSRRVDELEARK